MNLRTALAALHYNENADKGQAVTRSGELRWKVKHPKARKGEASVSSIKQEPTYGMQEAGDPLMKFSIIFHMLHTTAKCTKAGYFLRPPMLGLRLSTLAY